MIQLEGVSLTRSTFSLRGITLSLKKGEHFFIIGPSGSGKTLLLETIAGIHPDAGGRILMMGKDITDLPPEERGLSLMYQDYSLFPHLTVSENIGFGLTIRGIPHREISKVVESLVARYGIASLRDRYPASLSGGEKQRVALARALATSPALLMLDEPFAAIDPMLKSQFMHELRMIREQGNLTILQVSHSREETYALADRVAVMIDGTVRQVGTCDEVFSRPASLDVAIFTGFENILEGTVISDDTGGHILVAGRIRIAVPHDILPGTRLVACIRAADVRIHPEGHLCTPGIHPAEGIVTGIREDERGTSVTVDCGVAIISWFSHREQEKYQWRTGQKARVVLPSPLVHLVLEGHLEGLPISHSRFP
ncbi:MAG: Trehalose/maltose import ATP-binding protein MalK [Methanoregulaceae archaeon PtaB.Bin056]|nr:MAG: Trehalose/maltose import ATP-binding protein MalK [Methanoregulaceae archaeon PtaB.Bin056]